jgi:hypothetical protein
MDSYEKSLSDTRWFVIMVALLAFSELISWVMVGVGGIGWILCRRRPSVADVQ